MTRLTIAALILLVLTHALPAGASVVEGTIHDAVSGEPVPRVTIRIEGTGRAMHGNDDGRYRLRLEPGDYTLRFSHVSHYTRTIDVTVTNRPETLDVVMRPAIIELPGTRVYTRAYDPAQRIILEAIDHKEALLNKIRDYSFDGYTKLTVQKREDTTAGNYMLIAETQVKGYFEKPDHYKQIITARKQSSNIPAEGNLVSVGKIFNFNANRIDIGRQAIVTPTARDALDYYNYYLLDTTLVEGRPAFRLEIEPKSETDPLFAGEILIADSTFEVVGVDVTLNKGFDAPFIKDVRFSQRFARFENDIWWPVEIRLSGNVSISMPGIPKMTFKYVAALNQLLFNRGIPQGTFDQYALEVSPKADKVDSAAWDQGALIPLTGAEQRGYERIDSLEHRPPSPKRIALLALVSAVGVMESRDSYDLFHFNGVEGPYLGLGHNFRDLLPRTDLYAGSGWAFDGRYWQHRYQFSYLLVDRSQLRLGAGFHDQIVTRPVIFTDPRCNPTLVDLWSKINPFDYFLEKGFDLELGLTPARHFHVAAGYHDLNQYAVSTATNYGLWDNSQRRPNPPIVNGKLRSVSFELAYDTRPLIKNGRRIDTLSAVTRTHIDAGFETAAPELIANDFDYRRYFMKLERRQFLPGFGVMSFFAFGGLSDRALPPQRYFTVDIGDQDNMQQAEFKTLGSRNFVGDRVAALYLSHDFGTILFRKSRLPLIRRLPLSLMIYGGTFWSDLRQASLKVDGAPNRTAPGGYSEIGFGLGRVPPILMRLYFTWQLTAYDTRRFSVKFSAGF